jgi:ankyrin repeat protein
MKKVKCQQCKSNEIVFGIGQKEYYINDLSQKKLKKLRKKAEKEEEIFVCCLGDCSDEAYPILKNKDIKYEDPYNILDILIGNDIEKDIKTIIETNDVKSLKKEIQKGLNINSCLYDLIGYGNKDSGNNHWSILIYSIEHKSYDVAIELINVGADVNLPIEWTGTTPLMSIVGNKNKSKKQYDVVNALIDNGADVNIKSLDGEDVFHHADLWGKNKLKEYIINYQK